MGFSKAQGLEASSCSLHFFGGLFEIVGLTDTAAAFLMEKEAEATFFRCRVPSPNWFQSTTAAKEPICP